MYDCRCISVCGVRFNMCVLRVQFTQYIPAEQRGAGVDWVDRGSISRISDYVAAAMYRARANHYFLAGME